MMLAHVFTAGPASAAISSQPDCNSSFDVYDYTASAVASCGIVTYPLTSRTALSGGGESYDYRLADGNVARFFVPPQGFSPLTAPDSKLAEYHFPARPSDLVRLGAWETEMANVRVAPPPPFVAVIPDASFSGPPWSGWAVSTANNAVTSVEVGYNEPSYNNYSCSSDAGGMWAGIGDYHLTHDLGQDGTAHNVPGLGNHQAWFQILPNGLASLTPIARPGDYVIAYVAHSSSGYSGFVQDATNNQIQSWSAGGAYSGDSAEAEFERPLYNGITNMSDFHTLAIRVAYFNGGTYFNSPGLSLQQTLQYGSSGYPMAVPGSVGNQGAFTENWQRCS